VVPTVTGRPLLGKPVEGEGVDLSAEVREGTHGDGSHQSCAVISREVGHAHQRVGRGARSDSGSDITGDGGDSRSSAGSEGRGYEGLTPPQLWALIGVIYTYMPNQGTCGYGKSYFSSGTYRTYEFNYYGCSF
jgi:hypothetical protein